MSKQDSDKPAVARMFNTQSEPANFKLQHSHCLPEHTELQHVKQRTRALKQQGQKNTHASQRTLSLFKSTNKGSKNVLQQNPLCLQPAEPPGVFTSTLLLKHYLVSPAHHRKPHVAAARPDRHTLGRPDLNTHKHTSSYPEERFNLLTCTDKSKTAKLYRLGVIHAV